MLEGARGNGNPPIFKHKSHTQLSLNPSLTLPTLLSRPFRRVCISSPTFEILASLPCLLRALLASAAFRSISGRVGVDGVGIAMDGNEKREMGCGN